MTQEKTAESLPDYEEAKMLSEIRNGLQTCVEGIDAYLNWLSKAKLGEWNPDKINWIPQPGTDKGPYEKAHFDDTEDFKAMLQDLNRHGGKVTRAGYFYWLFSDGKTVGRKNLVKK